MAQNYCYIIRAGNHVKIGAAADPFRRLQELQTGNPVVLEIVAVLPGGFDMEKHLHEKFREDHYHGEWFHCGPILHWLFDVIDYWAAFKPKIEEQLDQRNQKDKMGVLGGR